MTINLQEVQQAIADLQLELVITLFSLFLLFFLGYLILRYSTNKARKTDIPTPKRPIVGLRLRMRNGTWQASSTTEANTWWADFWQGISTEFFGAVVTTIFLGVVVLIVQQVQLNRNLIAQEKLAIENRKAELILQLGSPDNTFAVEAARQLNAEGWLQDGTLQRRGLYRTNLQDANLAEADLQEAFLVESNLQGAFLRRANLQDANLTQANLQGAFLVEANLRDADLTDAIFNENTILPDARYLGDNEDNLYDKYWTSQTDMTRYTNPEHPDFWKANWANEQVVQENTGN